MDFKEIETKYRADGISLEAFKDAVKKLAPTSDLEASSYDHYYLKKGTEDFLRYRAGGRPELTMKVKMVDTNNFVRLETNVRLDPNQNNEEQKGTVEKFCELLGFTYNFTIFKTCFIYYWNNYNVVYYIVYGSNMQEQDRFIEIEMSETYPWRSEEEAWAELTKVEKLLEPMGIKPQRRVRLSLFEMFKK